MRIAFFVSSAGDADLAKATIMRLIEQKYNDTIYIISLTDKVLSRTDDIEGKGPVKRLTIDQVAQQSGLLLKDQLSIAEFEKIGAFIDENNIQHAYVGVPSSNSHTPYQIASQLKISCTIAYEYMFNSANHTFWSYIDKLVDKENCHFAVPLLPAKNDILKINPKAKVFEVGHLSIDRAQSITATNPTPVKKALAVENEAELLFVSGTTQPPEIDNQFLTALLTELSTGKYPNLQLRFGIHPLVNDPDKYLQALLNTCEKFPKTSSQLKILLPQTMEKKLQQVILSTPFILRCEVSGSDAGQAADKIAQAVPGALLNEAALKGKPAYFHEKTTVPYLPKEWFSENLAAFFTTKPRPPHTKEELGLKDTAPNLLIKLMS